MLDIIPNTEQMIDLVGKSLWEIWEKLCALIDEKYDMVKRGHMNINTVEVVRLYVHYMQEKIV